MTPAKIRLTELDGLRGWAALSVVIFHVFWECFGALFPEIKNFFTAGLMNGHFAICLFFVISGAALSAPFYNGGGRNYVMSAAVKRYVRLTLPIIFFSLLYFVLARVGFVTSHEAAVVLDREAWGGLSSNADPGIVDTFLFMLRDVYLGARGDRDILPFLWTMPIEMLGSMLLFLMMAVLADMPNPNRGFIGMGILLFLVSPYLGAFFLGAMLTQNRLRGKEWTFFQRNDNWVTPLALALIFAVVSITRMHHLPAIIGNSLYVLLATALLYLCMHNAWLKRFFGANPVSQFLGQISFTIYILHYIVITTLLSALVIYFQDQLTFSVAMSIAGATLATCVLLSWLFLPVDRISHRMSGRFANFVLRSSPDPAVFGNARTPQQ